MQQVKGAVLKSRLAFVEQNFGKAAVPRVLGRLAPDDRAALRLVLPVVWYPFALGERLDHAIMAELGNGDARFFERLGEASAAQNLSTVHKGYVVVGDPHAFLEKAPQIYRSYYEGGRREYTRHGQTSGELTTHDAQTFSAPDCQTIVGWHRKALEMCGARNVVIAEPECRARGGRVCRYRVSWE
jgi:uncharacterized protein (TIGR02265 family)